MRYLRKWQLVVVCLLALALLPFAPAPRGTAQAPGYTVTDLGTLGGDSSRAFGLDECGRVVGEAQAAAGASAPFRPFHWNNGVLTDLGTLGGSSGIAFSVNQSGRAVGSALTSGGLLHPFVRPTGGPMQDLGTLGGFTAEAQDINALGQVVGQSEDGALQDRAFIWQSGVGMQALSAPWGTPIRAFGINDAGQVAGSANLPTSGSHAFVTINGVAVDIGTLGGAVSVATEVNDSGAVAGYSYITIPPNTITQFFHAFRWKDLNGNGQSDSGEMIDLGLLDPSHKNSYAYDINNAGQVVGASETGAPNNNVSHAFIWQDTNSNNVSDPGELQDLNNLLPPGSGWTLQEARGINNRGQIVGVGLNSDNKVHAFLLTPTNVAPSPCAGTLQFSAASYNATEGDAPVTVTVTRTGGSEGAVSVNYATSDGTAAQPGDYTSTSGTLNFADGETSKTFTVTVINDALNESGETVNLTLSNANGAALGTQSTATLNINDNDPAPSLSINDVTVTEGNSGTTNATFTVSLSAASSQTVFVNYATADGTAVAPGDYTAVNSTTLTFNPGETSKNVTVAVVGDTTDEPNETFNVNLSSPTNATINDGTGVGTIVDDDGAPSLSIDNVTVTEGNSGTVNATFTVSLLPASGQAVSVNYATADGTATQPGDYAAKSGTLNFAIGETSKTVTVIVNGDTLFEGSENFFVNLSGATNATISNAQGTGTITDDDGGSVFQFSAATYTVGENGVTATINVNRTGSTASGVSVNYATSNGTATAGSDYTAASGTLNFGANETSKPFTITINNDTLDEPDETVNLALSSPFGGTLGAQSTAVLTINDNDAQPTFQFDSATYTIAEGAGPATITVTRTGGTNSASVSFATSNGTATGNSDFTPTSGTLNFAEGETSKTFNVPITDDALDEPDESLSLSLVPIGNATLGSPSMATLTITDNDPPPTLTIDDMTVSEGNAGTTDITFIVRLSAMSGKEVTVKYATADGTAVAPSDYAATSGTLTFNPAQTFQTVTVTVAGDTLDEPNETFFVNLSDATNATIGDSQSVGVIIDDDGPPLLTVSDVTVTEGNSGTTAATFTVTLAPVSGQAASVNYATSDGTATAGSDYAATSGTLNFAAGETVKTVNVNVNGDTVNEPNETFFVNLSGASNATLADAQGQGTIINDDTPTLRFSQATYAAGESAHFVTVTVTRTGDPTPAVGVSFATSDGTATERKDYTAVSGRLNFAAGETSKTFDVLLTEDAFTEPEETINLTLSNPTGGAALGTQSTATVNLAADDNPPPGVNPIDVSSEFVRQHYHDFLNREPDASGLAFWTGEIEQCGADAGCREVKRINVSAAFFLSIEFQQTGYLVYRTYKVAYGDATSPNVAGTVPVVRLQEFLPDTRSIGEGVVVGVGNWEEKLNSNKNAYMAEFVQRQRFLTAFPTTLTAAQFVDKLNQNAGGVLTQAERDQLVAQLSPDPTATATRASVLRSVAENAALQQNEFRRAFVLMQFYGYLRRNPDDPQDTDFRGWKFWLDKLNDHNGNYVEAEMVKAFLDSIEYRTRFAP